MKRLLLLTGFVMLLCSVRCGPAYGSVPDLYAMSVNNQNVYQINVSTGTVTTVSTTAKFTSTGIAFDGTYLFYWNSYNGAGATNKGIAKWDPSTDTHTIINTTDWLEENADVRGDGTLWLLDRSYTYDPGTGTPIDGVTDELYQINKITGARSATPFAHISGNTLAFAVGDTAWGPDGKLYISTTNVTYKYDNYNNYIWDPTTGNLNKIGGKYYAGLAWAGNKLYASDIEKPGRIFELNPTDFSEKALIATMPDGASIGDLTTAIPEPGTICIFGTGGIIFLRSRRK